MGIIPLAFQLLKPTPIIESLQWRHKSILFTLCWSDIKNSFAVTNEQHWKVLGWPYRQTESKACRWFWGRLCIAYSFSWDSSIDDEWWGWRWWWSNSYHYSHTYMTNWMHINSNAYSYLIRPKVENKMRYFLPCSNVSKCLCVVGGI